MKGESKMDYERAMEIINDEQIHTITLNQQNIWINNVDPRTKTAQILNADNESMEVQLSELMEDEY